MSACNKTLLALAVALASSGANAELKLLDDEALGDFTGQAGLTIDLESKYTIGEFMYKDAGSVFFKGISFGANTNEAPVGSAVDGFFDNVRIKLDVAGAGEQLDYGFSGVRKKAELQAAAAAAAGSADEAKFVLASTGQITASDAISAGLISSNANASGPLSIGDQRTFDDGDLVIHVSSKDYWQKLGGLENLLANDSLGTITADDFFGEGFVKGKDFNFSIDAIGLAASTIEAGDTIARDLMGHTSTGIDNDGADTTVLISDLSINGYLGPVDIHIENDGNGFNLTTPLGVIPTVGNADSIINWDTYINITDLDVYLDIAGVQINDLKINNVRGDVTDLDGNFAFGFAHSKQQIYAVRNTAGFDSAAIAADIAGGTLQNGTGTGLATDVLAVLNAYGYDGVAINTQFKGDKEIGSLSFGDTGTSIGQLYWTDIESYTNWTISAH